MGCSSIAQEGTSCSRRRWRILARVYAGFGSPFQEVLFPQEW